MSWLVQPSLVNEPFADPGVFVDFRFGRRALLFDLGDLTPLSPRQLLRVTHCFVSHTHMDHFAGFDRLLRVCLHRPTSLHLVGPTGFADHVEHKLKAYTLNLLDAQSVDFAIVASEFNGSGFDRVCEFRAREAFHRRDIPAVRLSPGVLVDEGEFRIDGALLDHGIPCLAFAFQEKLRVNVWSEGLRRLGLPVGPWLRAAKSAVRRRGMLDRGNPGTDAEQWGKYRNQFASPSIAHSQDAGSRCWILAVDGPQSNPTSWSVDLRCYWATIGRNAVSAKEAAMATRKKAKGKAQAKRKGPASKATRGRTVRKNKTIPKKVAKKAPRRPAPSKKPRPTAKPAGTPPISEQVPKTVEPEPGPAQPVSSEQRIGVVTHYYSHLSVVGMQLEPGATLRVGDVIHIRGHTTDFTQRVESLEVNHAPVTEVGSKDDFGLKVIEHAREHDAVFKVRS